MSTIRSAAIPDCATVSTTTPTVSRTAPGESKYPGDFYPLRATIPAAEAFRPLTDGGCPRVSG